MLDQHLFTYPYRLIHFLTYFQPSLKDNTFFSISFFFFIFFSQFSDHINQLQSTLMNTVMEKTKIFYLIGKNIQTSLSPLLHNKLFEMKNKPSYHYRLGQEGKIPQLQQLIEDPNFGGMSITIPFKKSYFELPQDQLNSRHLLKLQGQFASKSKIINTVVKKQTKQLIGYNTDIFGIQKVLQNIQRIGNVLILGAGATSQTFCYFFQNSHLCENIYMENRNEQKINVLATKYSKITNVRNCESKKINFIVNTLPIQVLVENVKMYEKLLLNSNLDDQLGYMDVNYRRSLNIVQNILSSFKITKYNGLDMLIWQAIQQNRLFCEDPLEQTELMPLYYDTLKKVADQAMNIKN